MSALFTTMGQARKDLAKSQAEYDIRQKLAYEEFHGLDLKSKAHAVAEEAIAAACEVAIKAQITGAQQEAQRLRALINTDFTIERNDRVSAYNDARLHVDELTCLVQHYQHRATVCRYRADLLP